MSAKKRVRWADSHEVREFDADAKKPKRELNPMEALEGGINAVCIYEGGASVDPASAAAQRARQRRDSLMARFEEGASFLGSIEAVEAGYEEPEERFNDAGIPIEPFHLKREREEGYFDESGTYVEYKSEDVEDTWADSLADVEVDEAWLARVRAAQAAQGRGGGEEEERTDDLSPEDLSAYKQRLLDLLQPGETTLHALRRLGRQRVERASSGPGAEAEGERPAPHKPQQVMPSPIRQAFDRLTELSSLLMEHGEYTIHSQTREQIRRSLDAPAEQAAGAGTGAGPKSGAAAGNGAAPAGAPERSPLAELAGAGGDAGSLLAQRLLAGAGAGAGGGEGEGGEIGARRMSTGGEGEAAAATSSGAETRDGQLGQGPPPQPQQQQEEEELDIFADEEDEQPPPPSSSASGPAVGAAEAVPAPAPSGPAAGAGGSSGEGAVPAVAAAASAGGREGSGDDVDMPSVDAENAAPAGRQQRPGDDGAGAQTGAEASGRLPQGEGDRQLEGFEFDAASGYWYNSDLGCYYDAAHQLYGDAASGAWFKYEGGGYQPV